MLAIIAQTVARFKLTGGKELNDDAILGAMREAGHTWRDRELNPVTTVRMFLLQILFGNVACDYVPRLAGKSVSGPAYCLARGRPAGGGFSDAADALHQRDGGGGARHGTVAGPSPVYHGWFQLFDAGH